MTRRWAVVLGLAALLVPGREIHAGPTIRVSGTGAGIGGMRLLAEAFASRRPGVGVDVLPSIGSTGGIRAVAAGEIDLACTSRPLRPGEGGGALVEEPYARTAFIFATRADNPVVGLSLAQIEEIFAGRRTAWPDGAPIRLVLRPRSDTFSVYLEGITPGMADALARGHRIPGIFVGPTDQEAAARIESTPYSFGTTSASLVAAERRRIKALAVDGVLPGEDEVADGRYPYTLALSLVYRRDAYVGAVREFVDFLFSPEGRTILARSGHLPLGRSGEGP